MYTEKTDEGISSMAEEKGVCCDNNLDICTKAEVAEHARFSDEDYPCTCL